MIRVEKYSHEQHALKLMDMELREADRDELLASTGLSDQDEGLIKSVNASDIVCYAYLYKDKLIALSGASSTEIEGFAIVWALGTVDVLKYWYEMEPLFIKHVDAVLTLPDITLLGNDIDMRNKAHIRWIKKLGFTLTGKYTERGGHKFEIFYKEGK